MGDEEWDSMDADQRMELLRQLLHALVVEVGDLGVKVSKMADQISALEIRAATRLN